jgi:hypothetical protein
MVRKPRKYCLRPYFRHASANEEYSNHLIPLLELFPVATHAEAGEAVTLLKDLEELTSLVSITKYSTLIDADFSKPLVSFLQ